MMSAAAIYGTSRGGSVTRKIEKNLPARHASKETLRRYPSQTEHFSKFGCKRSNSGLCRGAQAYVPPLEFHNL
jgi:hypothetical protein